MSIDPYRDPTTDHLGCDPGTAEHAQHEETYTDDDYVGVRGGMFTDLPGRIPIDEEQAEFGKGPPW